jgi:uncharacterized membrane protein YfcA
MQDKDVTTPFVPDWGTVVGLLLVILIGSLASTAGVGGGAIFVPLFQALVRFPLKDSTALSQALITAGSLVSVAMNLFSISPLDPHQPLIDFPLVLLLTPMLLVGVGVGVLLNYILPAYVISILLVMLMALLIAQSLGKGVRMWKSETANRCQRATPDLLSNDGLVPQHAVPTPLRNDGSVAQNTSENEASGSCSIRPSPTRQSLEEGSGHDLDATKLVKNKLVKDVEDSHREMETQRLLSGAANLSCSPGEDVAGTSVLNNWPGRSASRGRLSTGGESQLTSSIVSSAAQQLLIGVGRSGSPFEAALLGSINSHVVPGSSVSGMGASATRGPAWVNRRNAWMTGFLRNCSEHVEVESMAIQRHVFIPMPMPTLKEVYEEGEIQNPAAVLHGEKAYLQPVHGIHQTAESPRLANKSSMSSEHWRLKRSSSMPCQHYEPLLCAQDMAEALAPRRVHHLDAEHRRQTAGYTDEDLLQLIVKEASTVPVEGRHHIAGKTFYNDDDGFSTVGLGLTMPAEHTSISAEATAHGQRTAWKMRSYLVNGWNLIPKRVVMLLGLCWLTYVALQLGHSLSKVCSTSYWGTLAAQIATMPMFSACVAWWFTKKFEEHNVESKRKDNSQPSAAVEMELELNITVRPGVECEQREAMCDRVVCERDVEACPPELEGAVSEEPGVSQSAGSSAEKGSESMRFLLFQGLALFAGLIGGLLGLGGGMVIGPMLLHVGIHPQIGAATSGTMVLFSSSTALVAFSASGRLNAQYAAVFSVASMIAAVLGSVVIGGIVRRTGRVSLLVLSMAVVMLVGGGAVGGFGVVTIIQAVKNNHLGPTQLCP